MRPLGFATVASMVLVSAMATIVIGQETKLSDCPTAVRKSIEAECRSGRVVAVRKEKEEDEMVYWAEAILAGKTYAIVVHEDGTLVEMNLAVDEAEMPFDRCPPAVQATFRHEAFGLAIKAVGRDVKYGVAIYEAAVSHRGKTYEIVVAEDGTLVEKALIIEEDEIELAKCPTAVQAAFREHAGGGTIGDITRSAGIIRPTFEAEVESKGKVYLIEVAENGLLISKSLEAGEE